MTMELLSILLPWVEGEERHGAMGGWVGEALQYSVGVGVGMQQKETPGGSEYCVFFYVCDSTHDKAEHSFFDVNELFLCCIQ